MATSGENRNESKKKQMEYYVIAREKESSDTSLLNVGIEMHRYRISVPFKLDQFWDIYAKPKPKNEFSWRRFG